MTKKPNKAKPVRAWLVRDEILRDFGTIFYKFKPKWRKLDGSIIQPVRVEIREVRGGSK